MVHVERHLLLTEGVGYNINSLGQPLQLMLNTTLEISIFALEILVDRDVETVTLGQSILVTLDLVGDDLLDGVVLLDSLFPGGILSSGVTSDSRSRLSSPRLEVMLSLFQPCFMLSNVSLPLSVVLFNMTEISIRILKAGIDVGIHHDSETVPGFLGEVERLGGVPGDLLISCGLEK